MSFAPVVPLGGYAGWAYLNRTMDAQRATMTASPAVGRDMAHFREKIGTITSAEALVADRRLLGIALGAFGLEADIANRFFLRKVLEGNTLDPGALVNKLADKRYLEFSRAFGFGDSPVPRTQLPDFADRILEAYGARRFEAAVGERDADLRLALNARRELARAAAGSGSNDARWFGIMGSAPLRTVVQRALGLPSAFAAIDIDQQLSVLKSRSERILGSDAVEQFADPAAVEKVVRLFLLRSEAGTGADPSGASGALQILQAGAAGRLSLRV